MPTVKPDRKRTGDPEYRRNKPQAPTPPEGYGVRGFTVCIPDTPTETAFFLGALTELTKWTHYQLDHAKTAKPYAEFWRDIIEPAINDFFAGQNAPCLECQDEEDTKADDILSFVDGVVSTIQSGGIVEALGYAINNLGEVIINTAVRVIAFTVVGYLTAGFFDLFIGGVLVETIPVPEGKIIQVAWDTFTTNAKDVRGVLRVA